MRDPEISMHLRRIQGESPNDRPWDQSRAFVQRCLEEGLDNDHIVILGRAHDPSLEAHTGVDAGLERMIERLRKDGVRPVVDVPEYVDWGKVVAAPSTEPDWCVPFLVESRASVSLIGPAKVGKSLLTLEAAASLAAGRSFLGVDLTPTPVVYLDWENSPALVGGRLANMGFTAQQLGLLHYECFPQIGTLDTVSGAQAVLDRVTSSEAKLVVIDTLQRVLTGEENSSQGIRDMYRHLMVPLRRMGVASLRLDHSGKDLTRGPRGSSAKLDDVDVVWQLSEREGMFALTRTHSRSGLGPAGLLLRRDSNPLRHEVHRELTESDRVARDALTAEDLIEALDELDVPQNVGRLKAGEALRGSGISCNTDVLSEAVKLRKQRITA